MSATRPAPADLASAAGQPSVPPAPLPTPAVFRRRLFLWYAATSSLILLALVGALYAAVMRIVSDELDRSLRDATEAVGRAARVQAVGGLSARQAVLAAAAELNDEDRPVFVFDGAGRAVGPAAVPEYVRRAALVALRGRPADLSVAGPTGQRWRLHGEAVRLDDGSVWAVVAAGDEAAVERPMARVLVAFGAVALLALLVIAAVGQRIARLSVRPLEQALAHMRRFVADAAHELRTPVATLRARADLALARERSGTEYAAALRGVATDARRLGTLVDGLLMLARADAGERSLRRERFFLDDAASEAVEAAAPLAQERGVALRLRAYDEAPVEGDVQLVQQLLLILLDNATKFTGSGGEVVVDVIASGGAATVTVTDTGPGIPAGELPRIFDRFYRGEAARGTTSGAGLGLAIARWIAGVHDARLEVESRPGAGTCFRFSLPLSPVTVV
ncbi:MAG: HAMP domain-containing histidine kinase [Gemmatimonadetes bacterium]|nr:HAMP domain-containing histidine kinase [Gemmatimonadota bacterium]